MNARAVSAADRAVVGALGLLVVVLSAGLVDRDTTSTTTYGGVSASFAVLELVVGVALAAAGLMLLADRSTAMLGSLSVCAAVAWFAPVWVGWNGGPSLARNLGLVLAPVLPVVIFAVAARLPPQGAGLGRRILGGLVGVFAVAALAAAIALVVVRDPLRDLYCWSDCTATPLLGRDDLALTHRLTQLLLGIEAASGMLAALVGSIRLARVPAGIRRGSTPALAAAALAGLALAAYAASLLAEPRELPDRPLYVSLFVLRALALLGLAAGLAWLAVRPRLVRGLVTRLAVDIDRSTAEGGLGRVLAEVLHDPGLRLGYPVGAGGSIVDAEGLPLVADPERRVTQLVTEDGVLAVVESNVVSIEALERELSPTAHLALGNERLRAEALARLADVTASRARIVETADAVRRRMERDLHDGAQQRLLALTYDLRVALTIAEASGHEHAAAPLRSALDQAVAAAQELREVAHGIFPAELGAAGLEAALESLADLRPLRLTIDLAPGRRYRSEVENAVYAVLAEAGDEGSELDVALHESDSVLRVTVAGDIEWGERLVRLEDRIGAAGGSVRVASGQLTATLPV